MILFWLVSLIALLVALAVSTGVELAAELGLVLAAVVVRILSRADSSDIPRSLWIFLGAATVLAPLAGEHTLLVFALFLLLRYPAATLRGSFGWCWPYLALLGAWICAEFFVQYDPGSFGAYRQDGVLASLLMLHRSFALAAPGWAAALLGAAKLGVCAALFGALTTQPGARRDMLSGLIGGLVAALVLSVLQISGLVHGLPSQTAYWNEQRRISGTFSDPNAFGIAAALLVPILIAEGRRLSGVRRTLVAVMAVALPATALFSGSRTLLLALALYAAYGLYRYRRGVALAAVGVAAAAILALNVLPPVMRIIEAAPLPSAVTRAVESVSWNRLSEAFFSRAVFLKVGLAVAHDHPLVGVGYERFREFVPTYSDYLGLGTQLWQDNSNNFYVGALAETGLAGLLLLALVLSRLRWKWDSPAVLRCGAVVFGLLLFTGPHLEFSEVAVITALLFAGCAEAKPIALRASGAVALTALMAAVLVEAWYGTYGMYRWDRSAASYVRWSAPRAGWDVRCDEHGAAVVRLSAGRSKIEHAPVVVRIRGGAEEIETILRTKEQQRIEVRCSKLAGAAREYPPFVHVTLRALPYYMSAKGWRGDPRVRGVKIYFDAPKELLVRG